jgi:thymidylate synthase (FAD)
MSDYAPDFNNKEHRDAITRNLANAGNGIIEDACEMIEATDKPSSAKSRAKNGLGLGRMFGSGCRSRHHARRCIMCDDKIAQALDIRRFEYLDKGYVELVDHMGSDRAIAEAAWVSSDRAAARTETAVIKIIRYLAREGHWTPFGQTAIKLRFRVPIFIARQLMRSSIGIVWNEESRRYVDSPPEFYVPEVWRCRSQSMKQGSGETFDGTVEMKPHLSCVVSGCSPGVSVSVGPIRLIEAAYRVASDTYKAMIAAGIAPEQARIVLPVATYTTIVGTFNIASLARVYKLRSHPHAQQEIRELAACIDSCVKAARAFPFSWDELKGGEE